MTSRCSLALVLSVALLGACDNEFMIAGDGIDAPPVGFVASQALWPVPSLSVCWENDYDRFPLEREWVRTAVQGTWEAVSAVRFSGWRPCAEGEANIRINVRDAHVHVKALGSRINTMADGMVLNFTFQTWAPPICRGAGREFCIRAYAVHEFGHALGFAHEQNRPDTPEWCDEVQGTIGDVQVGQWDLDSVMNYCNPEFTGNGDLSQGDVHTVQYFYGGSGPLFDPNAVHRLTNNFLGEGRSLDTYGDAPHTPFAGTTGDYSGQRWIITQDGTGRYHLSNRFLGPDVVLTGDTPHGPLRMAPKGSAPGQRWLFIGNGAGQFRLSSDHLGTGWSLDTYSNEGNGLFMAPAGNFTGQYWSVVP